MMAVARPRCLGPSLYVECLLQISDQIVNRFNSHRQADDAVGDAGGDALFRMHRGVAHRSRVFDQRLHPAQRLGQREDVRGTKEMIYRLRAAPQGKRDHSPESLLLPGRQFVPFMRFETRVKDLFDVRMLR